MKKRLFAIVLVSVMAMAMVACGKEPTIMETEDVPADLVDDLHLDEDYSDLEAEVGLPNNSLWDISAEEMTTTTGISFAVPENAENVVYNAILSGTLPPIAEMVFTIDGVEYYARSTWTMMTTRDLNADYSTKELLEMEGYNISGLYYDFDNQMPASVSYNDAMIYYCDEAAFVAWIDDAPGIAYNVCIAGENDPLALEEVANMVYEPMQGDAE